MPSAVRSVGSERASDRRRRIFAGVRAVRRACPGSRKQSVKSPTHAPPPARQHPGLLRGPGHGRFDREGGAGPAPFAGARERADGRHRRGVRLLPQRRHAESDHHRIAARPRARARRTRPTCRALRSRDQGHRDRPPQRCRSLSRAAAAGDKRISGRPCRRATNHRKPVQPLQRQGGALSARRAARDRAPFATTPRSPSRLRSSARW